MQASRAWLILSLAALVGCGGTFTHEGGDPNGGSSGNGASGGTAGSVNHGGDAGVGPKGGDAGYGAVSGDISYGATGGDIGGYGSSGGDISYGGDAGAWGGGGYGNSGGDISYGGDAGAAGTGCGYGGAAQATPVTFVFSTNTPVYTRGSCTLGFDLYGCDPTTPLTFQADCVADCSQGSGCVACGACPLYPTTITPDAPQQGYWSGETYTYGTLPGGCACANGYPAGAGQYTVSITTYLSEADAMNGTNGYEHRQQFTYPPPNGQVNVFVGFLAE